MREHTTYSEGVRSSINRTECGRTHPAHKVRVCTPSAQSVCVHTKCTKYICKPSAKGKRCVRTSGARSARPHQPHRAQVHFRYMYSSSTCTSNARALQTCYSSSAQNMCAHQMHKACKCTTRVRSALLDIKRMERARPYQVHEVRACTSNAQCVRVHIQCTEGTCAIQAQQHTQ